MLADQRHGRQQPFLVAVHDCSIVYIAGNRQTQRLCQIMVGFVKQEVRHQLARDVAYRQPVSLRHRKEALVRRQSVPAARIPLHYAVVRRRVQKRYPCQVYQRLDVVALVALPDEAAELVRHHGPVDRHEESLQVIFQHPAVPGIVLRLLPDGVLKIFHGRQRPFAHPAVEARRNELRLKQRIDPLRYPRLNVPIPEHRREHLPKRRPLYQECD